LSGKPDKQQRQRAKRGTEPESTGKPTRRWPVQQALILLIGIAIGFALRGAIVADDAEAPPGSTLHPARDATETPPREGATDAYGRSPDHPHYGHAHP